MTKNELIKELKKYPGKIEVKIEFVEKGIFEFKEITTIRKVNSTSIYDDRPSETKDLILIKV